MSGRVNRPETLQHVSQFAWTQECTCIVKMVICELCHEDWMFLWIIFKGRGILFYTSVCLLQVTWLFQPECIHRLSKSLSLRFQTPRRPRGILSDRRYSSVLSVWCLVNAEFSSRCGVFQDEMIQFLLFCCCKQTTQRPIYWCLEIS